jgi:hypothetical protein
MIERVYNILSIFLNNSINNQQETTSRNKRQPAETRDNQQKQEPTRNKCHGSPINQKNKNYV